MPLRGMGRTILNPGVASTKLRSVPATPGFYEFAFVKPHLFSFVAQPKDRFRLSEGHFMLYSLCLAKRSWALLRSNPTRDNQARAGE